MKNIKKFINIHTLLLLVFILFVIAVIVKLSHFGTRINQEDIERDESGAYLDQLDLYLPGLDENGEIIRNYDHPTILAFGNAPFADDRNSPDNLANLIAEACDGTVYNCGVEGSYLASVNYVFDADTVPMDAFTFYWMCLLIDDLDTPYFTQAFEAFGDNVPDGAREAYDILTSIDMNEVDIVTVMYDATDYLQGHEMYDDANDTNIQQFTGNLEAGIEYLRNTYPHIRVIVLSPTYAYAINEKGEYVSSDMYTYGWDVLSTYSIKEYTSCARQQVTFVDNLYGTVTEDNAKEYLIDNLHLNPAGRKLVAQRFMKALNYYSN